MRQLLLKWIKILLSRLASATYTKLQRWKTSQNPWGTAYRVGLAHSRPLSKSRSLQMRTASNSRYLSTIRSIMEALQSSWKTTRCNKRIYFQTTAASRRLPLSSQFSCKVESNAKKRTLWLPNSTPKKSIWGPARWEQARRKWNLHHSSEDT